MSKRSKRKQRRARLRELTAPAAGPAPAPGKTPEPPRPSQAPVPSDEVVLYPVRGKQRINPKRESLPRLVLENPS
jgi:hypothetical protein